MLCNKSLGNGKKDFKERQTLRAIFYLTSHIPALAGTRPGLGRELETQPLSPVWKPVIQVLAPSPLLSGC